MEKPGRNGSDSSYFASSVTVGQLLKKQGDVVGRSMAFSSVQISVLPLSNPVDWDKLVNVFPLPFLIFNFHLNHSLRIMKQMRIWKA